SNVGNTAANAARRPPAARPEGTSSLLLDLVLENGRPVRLLPAELVAAEVAVRRRLLVDGAQEVEHLQDAVRTQVEVLVHGRDDLLLGHLVRAEGLDGDGGRLRDADRVRHLNLAAVREARGDDVLRDVAAGIGGRAVDLRRILTRECTAAVSREAALRVDVDLAYREIAVAHR